MIPRVGPIPPWSWREFSGLPLPGVSRHRPDHSRVALSDPLSFGSEALFTSHSHVRILLPNDRWRAHPTTVHQHHEVPPGSASSVMGIIEIVPALTSPSGSVAGNMDPFSSGSERQVYHPSRNLFDWWWRGLPTTVHKHHEVSPDGWPATGSSMPIFAVGGAEHRLFHCLFHWHHQRN